MVHKGAEAKYNKTFMKIFKIMDDNSGNNR